MALDLVKSEERRGVNIFTQIKSPLDRETIVAVKQAHERVHEGFVHEGVKHGNSVLSTDLNGPVRTYRHKTQIFNAAQMIPLKQTCRLVWTTKKMYKLRAEWWTEIGNSGVKLTTPIL